MPVRGAARTKSSVGARERADTSVIELELTALGSMSAADLRTEWIRLYRSQPPKKLSRNLLKLGVAWKMQERAFGGLSATTKRQIGELAQALASKADLAKARTVNLRPGARLIREWNGETHEVLVVADGYRWRGKTWRSLSVIAREMTGTQWSGPRFFGIGRRPARSLGDEDAKETADE
jgi:hypothetical protein